MGIRNIQHSAKFAFDNIRLIRTYSSISNKSPTTTSTTISPTTATAATTTTTAAAAATTNEKYSTNAIRTEFINFFKNKNYFPHPSASLVPENDPNLLFTSAGMVPFKPFFLGERQPKHQKIVSVQKCLRVGGKHNDLEEVGYSPRHNTYFEMLGTFSFGELTRVSAIEHCWQFLTKQLNFPIEKLRITVYKNDDESYKIWENTVGIPASRLHRKDEQDNWWSMGNTGPCGPCTEIFWDKGDHILDEDLRYLELWNIVFMEKEQLEDGTMKTLKNPCIDTGMGLERLVSVLQNKSNSFEIDTFQAITAEIESKFTSTGLQKSVNESNVHQIRIIADHIRACTHLVSEKVLPGPNGREYVLRRLIRRASFACHNLGITEPMLSYLAKIVQNQNPKEFFPEVHAQINTITNAINTEEILFQQMLKRGMKALKEITDTVEKSESRELAPEKAFYLIDTLGLPIDIIISHAREKSFTLDLPKIESLMAVQKKQSKSKSKKSELSSDEIKFSFQDWKEKGFFNSFTGYEELECEAKVIAVHSTPKMDFVMLDQNPFYGEAGGQVGDQGVLTLKCGGGDGVNDGVGGVGSDGDDDGGVNGGVGGVGDSDGGCYKLKTIKVLDCQIQYENGYVLSVPANSKLTVNNLVNAKVDREIRLKTEKHHTATHILHEVLLSKYGHTTSQAGSFVNNEKLRFDFSKPNQPLNVIEIEEQVNRIILENSSVLVENNVALDQAIAQGAKANFTEKYGAYVRTVKISKTDSLELCCGTHVKEVGCIFPFKITSCSSIAAGKVRIEACVGEECIKLYKNDLKILSDINNLLKGNSGTFDATMSKVKVLIKKKKEAEDLILALANEPVSPVHCIDYKETKICLYRFNDYATIDYCNARLNSISKQDPNNIHFAITQNKLFCKIATENSSKANSSAKLLKECFSIYGNGKGGGTDSFAQGKFSETPNETALVDALISLSKSK